GVTRQGGPARSSFTSVYHPTHRPFTGPRSALSHILLLDRKETTAPSRERPLVPRTLRLALAGEPLPARLCEATGLPAGWTVGSLRPELLEEAPATLRRRVELLAKRLLDNHRRTLRHVRIVDRPWPSTGEPCAVDWGDHLRRRLTEVGLIDDRTILADATYGSLLAHPRLGARSVYAIAVAAEAAVDRAHPACSLVFGSFLPVPVDEKPLETAMRSYVKAVSGLDGERLDAVV